MSLKNFLQDKEPKMDRVRILVVEDEGIMAKDIQRQLEGLGYEVPGVSATGQQALQIVANTLPDLILMDIKLKGDMDGIEAAKQIHTQFDIPVVYATAYADEKTLTRAKETRSFGYLLKPFDKKELYSIIEIALSNHRTEKKRKEDARIFADTLSSIGEAVIATDPRGHVLFLNSVAKTIFGIGERNVCGLDITTLIDISNKEGESIIKGLISDIVQNGLGMYLNKHLLHMSKTNKVPLSGSVEPIRDESAKVYGVVFTFHNTTDIELVEQRLKRSTTVRLQGEPEQSEGGRSENTQDFPTPEVVKSIERNEMPLEYEKKYRKLEECYRQLIEFLPDPVVVQENGKILSMNRAGLGFFGVTEPDQVIGRCFYDFVHPDHRAGLQKLIEEGAAEKKFFAYQEEKFLNTDGNIIRGEIRAIPILHYEEPATQIIIRDVTEKKRLEEKLVNAQKMEVVGRLASGIAHDFNNILTVINGYSEILLEKVDRNSPYFSEIESIYEAGEHAASLTSQLLLFSRRHVGEPEIVNLNSVILNLKRMLERLIGEDIQLITVLDPELTFTKCDPVQVEQVIMNLSINARDAMPNGGRLLIETKNLLIDEDHYQKYTNMRPGKYVMLSVTDEGVGICKEDEPKIFDPYFTTKEREKGTGLGLSTVYDVVKQSGGNIAVYSEVGCGTSFTLYFPSIEVMKNVCGQKTKAEGAGGGTETILIVEDEDSVRNIVKNLLSTKGYTVLEAKNGTKAVEILRQYEAPIHLILTDVVMPRMRGLELIEQCKKISPQTSIMCMSGYIESGIVYNGFIDRNIPFVQKPLVPDTLLRKIREVLEKGGG